MPKDSFRSVDHYHDLFSEEIKMRMEQIRKLIHEIAPEVEESIRYNMPAFKVGKRHLYYAAYKNHIGFYPVYKIPTLEKELKFFRGKQTKDSLHFFHRDELPIALIRKVITFLVHSKS